MDHAKDKIITYSSLPIGQEKRTQFDQLADLLVQANAQVNLTAITDEEEIYEKHFADSLAIRLWEGFADIVRSEKKILDLGTGGGFPGMPIKIAYPPAEICLLDATRKKLEAIDMMISNLDLHDVRTIWGRAEELGRNKEHREKYDLVVSRAVAYLPALIECAVPFLKIGGSFVAYKRGDSQEEIDASAHALQELNAEISETIPYRIADGDLRQLVVICKKGQTPDKYPRRPGKPMKKPL